MAASLANLDELTHRCWNKETRGHVAEAITCYRAGAIRSSIVATWISVFFDLIAKVRDLSISGDGAASDFYERFEIATRENNVAALLSIERQILDFAKNDLELIGALEHLALSRIQEDRNRCAHPTIDVMGGRFEPSAELARAHLVCAIELLMQYPPTQGKAALEDILSVVRSQYFPFVVEKAAVALGATGLARPKSSLLRNAIIVFLKSSVGEEESTMRQNFLNAMGAVEKLHYGDTQSILEVECNPIFRRVADEKICYILEFINRFPNVQSYLSQDVIDKISSFVTSISGDDVYFLPIALEIDTVKKSAGIRASTFSLNDFSKIFPFELHETLRSRLIELLSDSASFDRSNAVSEVIEQYFSDFSHKELSEILSIGEKNTQVMNSFAFGRLRDRIEELPKGG